MPLDVATELASAMEAYITNASYAEDASVAKARSFVTACRKLIILVPKMTGSREATTTMNPELIQKEMQSAIEWLQANDNGETAVTGGPRTRIASFEGFR